MIVLIITLFLFIAALSFLAGFQTSRMISEEKRLEENENINLQVDKPASGSPIFKEDGSLCQVIINPEHHVILEIASRMEGQGPETWIVPILEIDVTV